MNRNPRCAIVVPALQTFLLASRLLSGGELGITEISVVVPNAAAEREGDASTIRDGYDPLRYQQIYPAHQFRAVDNPMLITQIAWRRDGTRGIELDFVRDVRIRLSTKDGSTTLDCVFDHNTGDDAITVFEGPLHVVSENIGPPGGPKLFDPPVDLQNPFLYDPRRGHLLLDFVNFTGVERGPFSDVDRSIGANLMLSCSPESDGCDCNSCSRFGCRHSGLVTRFTFRPIPVHFRRGDCNDDGAVDITDAITTLGSLFLGREDVDCADACDSNDDGGVDVSDAITTLGVLFLGEGRIPLPGIQECGDDPIEDGLTCHEYGTCP